jgi:ribosome-binding factor A
LHRKSFGYSRDSDILKRLPTLNRFMPEQRARAHHRSRVANTFSEEIGAMLEGELSDPRIAPSYVTDVVLAPGGKSARIYVAVHGSEQEEQSTLAGLMTARAYIRSQLRERMGVRHVPDLTFAIDRSEKLTGRIEELLGRLQKREQKYKRTDVPQDELKPNS